MTEDLIARANRLADRLGAGPDLQLYSWAIRAGRLEMALELLFIEADRAARRLRAAGETDAADSLTERCLRTRTVLIEEPLS